MTVSSLRGISMETLSRASNEAFGDYAVDVQMTPAEMETLCRQNSVSLEDSAGLFDDERLVGFWLNGIRTIEDVTWGYDSGTAICKAYRGRGLLSRLAELSDSLVEQRGVREYVLEVLTQNEKAYEIYRKLGFEVRRKLLCPKRLDRSGTVHAVPEGLTVAESTLDPAIFPRLPSMEYRPSWQYADTSMIGIREMIHTVCVRREERILGCGMAITDRPRIAQLRFEDPVWDGPIPALVLERLCRALERRPVIAGNVDQSAGRTLALLARHGFELDVEQFEMTRLRDS